MKRIALINFDSKREKLFRSCVEQLQENYEVLCFKNAKELKEDSSKINSIFCMHSRDLTHFEKMIELIQSSRPNVALNVVFKKREFDVLLRAFDFHLTSILDRKFSPGDIQKSLTKSELNQFSKSESELPIQNLINLFSSPIKIKDDEALYTALAKYFNEFSTPIEFAIVKIHKSTFEHVQGGEFYEEKCATILRSKELPRFYIGQYFELEKNIYAFPIYNKKDSFSWLLCRVENEIFDIVFNKFLFRFLENTLIYRKNIDKRENLQALAEKDDVTGLYNQRKLTQDLEEAIQVHESANLNFAIMFIDVDHFKKVNDNFGHVIGSKMLIGIGELLAKELRGSDQIYRYGGDEFVVIMPKVDIETVHKIAVRVQKKMKEKIFNIDEAKDYKLSVSIGIAEYPSDATTAEEVINFADEMMYVSKKSGRGKVFHVGEITDDALSS
jgi:diguanylate cyclase (GGDEF)-like protein